MKSARYLLTIALLFISSIAAVAAVIDTITANEAAIYYGSEKWGKVSILKMDTFFDPLTEHPVVYVYTLSLNKKGADVSGVVDNYIQLKKHINNNETDIDLNTKNQLQELDLNIKNNFGTVMIAASDSLPPLILRHQGIYSFYFELNEQLEFASKSLPYVNKNGKYYLVNFFSALQGFQSEAGLVFFQKNGTKIEKRNLIKKKRTFPDKIKRIDLEVQNKRNWKVIKSKLEKLSGTSSDSISKIKVSDGSKGPLVEEGYINGVPYYEQDRYGVNTCGPVATAQLLGYWDRWYPNLVDWGDMNNPDGIAQMVEDLKITQNWSPTIGTWGFLIAGGLEEFTNNSDYRNNLNFNADGETLNRWTKIKDNISINRPLIIFVHGKFEETDGTEHDWNHFMTIVGFEEYQDPTEEIVIVHPNDGINWNVDFEFNFRSTVMNVYTAVPGGQDLVNPQCFINSPNTGGTFSGNVPIQISASDVSGIELLEFEYSTDGVNWSSAGQYNNNTHSRTTFAFYLNTSGVIDNAANFWIRARSMDNWHNYSPWDEIDNPITIHNQTESPNAIITTLNLSPSSGVEPGSAVSVSGTAVYDSGEPVTGVAEITAGGNTWTASIIAGVFSRTIYAPNSSGYVVVIASDGNISETNQAYLSVLSDGDGDNFDFYRNYMCHDVQSDDPWDPVSITNWFRSDDEIAYNWVHLRDLYVPVRIKWEWYSPTGENHLDDTYSSWSDDPQDYGYLYWDWHKHWSGYYIDGYSQSDREGRHSVKIFAQEEGNDFEYMESQYYIISYDFKEHLLCEGVSGTDYSPINPKSIFHQSDDYIYTWSKYTDVTEAVELRTEWYEPNGSLYSSDEYTIPDPGVGSYWPDYMQWSYLYLDGYSAENKCGSWEVRKYERDPFGNWDLLYTEQFEVIEDPDVNPQLTLNVANENSFEGQNVIIDIQASDNSYLSSCELFWYDGQLHNQLWSDIFNASFSSSFPIGVYVEGEEIEYWAEVIDASGNQVATNRQYLTVQDTDTEGPSISNIAIEEYNGNGDGIISSEEQIRISFSLNDPSGISDANLFIDDNQVLLAGNYYVITGPFTSGSHPVAINAADADLTPSFKTVYTSFTVEESNYLDVSITECFLPAVRGEWDDGVNCYFTVESNLGWDFQIDWVLGSTEWLIIQPDMNPEPGGYFMYSNSNNVGIEYRVAEVRVVSESGISRVINVVQDPAYIDVVEDHLVFEYDNQAIQNLSISSFPQWTCTPPSWITVNPSSGSGEGVIEISVNEINMSHEARSIELNFFNIISGSFHTLQVSDHVLITQEAAPNMAPVIDSPVSDQYLDEHFDSYSISISDLFVDPNGDVIEYSISGIDNNSIVDASIIDEVLTIYEGSLGTTNVHIRATDPFGLYSEYPLRVTIENVNDPPFRSNQLSDKDLFAGFSHDTIIMSEYFSDPDNDLLTFSTLSSNISVITANISEDTLFISEVNIGDAELYLEISDGSYVLYDTLCINVSVMSNSVPDNWTYDPAGFSLNGQVTGKVFIDDVAVEGGYLGAFVGEECRGYIEAIYFGPADHYVFMLMIQSNNATGETVHFRYYDPVADTIIPLMETVEFTTDMTIGDASDPFALTNRMNCVVPLVAGWNWVSLNVHAEDMTPGNLVPGCTTEGDYIKNQTLSTQYYSDYGWFGPLDSLTCTDLYKVRMSEACAFDYVGSVTGVETCRPLAEGWSWISFPVHDTLPVADALASLTPMVDDYVKNQTQSTQYYDGYGWFGSLEYMVPGDGYMVRLGHTDTICFPFVMEPVQESARKSAGIDHQPGISFNPHVYEFNGSLTASLENMEVEPGDFVYAFADGQCRGFAAPSRFAPTDRMVFPLMVFSNEAQGDKLSFVFYDASADAYFRCHEQVVFASNMVVNDAVDPLLLNTGDAVYIEEGMLADQNMLSVYPNPFKEKLYIEYSTDQESEVMIELYDMYGRLIRQITCDEMRPGIYTYELDSKGLPSGTYLLKTISDNMQQVRRVVHLK